MEKQMAKNVELWKDIISITNNIRRENGYIPWCLAGQRKVVAPARSKEQTVIRTGNAPETRPQRSPLFRLNAYIASSKLDKVTVKTWDKSEIKWTFDAMERWVMRKESMGLNASKLSASTYMPIDFVFCVYSLNRDIQKIADTIQIDAQFLNFKNNKEINRIKNIFAIR